MSSENAVLGAYESLRKKLIQTSLRNRMINYRQPNSRSATGLQIEQESSAQVWTELVGNRKKFGFTGPVDQAAEQSNLDLEHLELALEEPQNDTSDLLLLSTLPKSKRESRLLGTFRAAQEQLDERGVNTLFLVLGMLKWKEPEEQGTHLAPLILIPVALERTNRGEFKLSYDEGDIGTNLSLQTKLKELGLELPDLVTDSADFTPEAYFESVGNTFRELNGWEVLPDSITLNFFSFEKIALFLDLDLARWPENFKPIHDADIAAALGEGYSHGESNLSEQTHLDEVRSVEEAREIFPADSSQLLVLQESKSGTSMVIEGPPGTGKSQTITNLIAEMVSQGKKVLFVSEKMAALEVVYRKLEEAGLENAALELHGNKSNRKKFYEEIKRTWSLRSELADAGIRLELLSQTRQRLNEYVLQLHQPLSPYQVSPRRLMAIACTLPEPDEADFESNFDAVLLRNYSWADFERIRPFLKSVQTKVREIGVPQKHPFWGCALQFCGPEERIQIERSLRLAIEAFEKLETHARGLANKLCISPPTSLGDIAVLNRCVEIAVLAPPLRGVVVKTEVWREKENDIRRSVAVLRSMQDTIKQYKSRIHDHAWGEDWTDVQSAVSRRADSLFGRMAGEYKQSIARISTVNRTSEKISPTAAKEIAKALFKVQLERAEISKIEQQLQALYGVQWVGFESDPNNLEGLLSWMLKISDEIEVGAVPASMLNLFEGKLDSKDLQSDSKKLGELDHEFANKLALTIGLLRADGLTLERRPIDDIRVQLSNWHSNVTRLTEIVGWNLLLQQPNDQALAGVYELASRWEMAADRLESHVLWNWVRTAIKRAHEERPALNSFDRTSHEQAVNEFKKLDDEVLLHNRARVVCSHLANLPQAGDIGSTAGLYRQCELRRGHKSVRWAFEKYEEVLLRIKPVCMMSPLSVATYLPCKPGLFDVVIFDEASQVRPEDALSAIARAKQTIVVGDSRQMPPTSFFDTLAQDDDGEEEGFDESIGRMESVLALCSAAVQNSHRRRSLRWHYRSLHESLIQPSNRLFYEDKLVIFPSPVYATTESGSALGLRFHYNPQATYDRGAQRKVNVQQAEDVARAVVEHLTKRTHESLLVVAFSKDQQQAVQDACEKLIEPGLLAEYNALHPFEPFKVKNLETVQGDERDVIFISIGYGRDLSGHLSMNFGPLNRESGGRRLNVLITRSKKRTEVFSSIRSGDIIVDEQRESGLRALKVFLEFAETGILEDRRVQGEEEDSEFEVQVREGLERRGYSVDIQVGTAGFRIDLAVRHPKKPGQYILGVECDGATYHSARSARDRDKLRQAVLESRGWTLHRVWSTDWWRDRDAALSRCVSAIEAAIAAYDADESDQISLPPPPHVSEIQIWTDSFAPSVVVGAPYQQWDRPFSLQGSELHALPAGVMANCVVAVVDHEGPIHIELLVKRIREAAGLGRAGSRIKQAVLQGIGVGVATARLRRIGEFLYSMENPKIVARSRESLSSPDNQAERIAPEELDMAVIAILEVAVAASLNDVVTGVRKFFGYGSNPMALPALVLDRLTHLIQQQTVSEVEGIYRIQKSLT
jgi:very-short-patch-repair endonuclease